MVLDLCLYAVRFMDSFMNQTQYIGFLIGFSLNMRTIIVAFFLVELAVSI